MKRLQAVAPKAEEAGVVRVVQVYDDVCNANDRGFDIYREIRELGRERICEFHFKENGVLLGQGKVDFKKVRAALDDIGYRGWIQIEGTVPPGAALLESYRANVKFVRETLG